MATLIGLAEAWIENLWCLLAQAPQVKSFAAPERAGS